MPAFLITAILLDRFGRKPLAIGTMLFSGVFYWAGSVVRNYGVGKVVRMVCGILGIFGMAGTYNLFIYTAELFPTVVRNAALGCATQAAQMGAILAPLVVVLGGGLPFAVFGACGTLGALLAFFSYINLPPVNHHVVLLVPLPLQRQLELHVREYRVRVHPPYPFRFQEEVIADGVLARRWLRSRH
uniref:Major facilitator superfamily (MFS) profile domain-containing protein n=1 Tax=Nelumbo nucifera TaxID=4432 RepID=A0A822ZTI9_NELNU|nr:TPA_asm: hypothetical protein HUJ06_016612 [Nelumbo nucifera]